MNSSVIRLYGGSLIVSVATPSARSTNSGPSAIGCTSMRCHPLRHLISEDARAALSTRPKRQHSKNLRSLCAYDDRVPRHRIIVLFAIGVLLSSACTSDDNASGGSSDATTGSLPEAAQEIIQSEPYEHGRWSWYAADTAGGDALLAQDGDVLTLLGSTTKLFTVGTYLDTIGADSTLETPVYAVGNRTDGTLDGDLVLVGSGDFILGSRGVWTTAIRNSRRALITSTTTRRRPPSRSRQTHSPGSTLLPSRSRLRALRRLTETFSWTTGSGRRTTPKKASSRRSWSTTISSTSK